MFVKKIVNNIGDSNSHKQVFPNLVLQLFWLFQGTKNLQLENLDKLGRDVLQFWKNSCVVQEIQCVKTKPEQVQFQNSYNILIAI